MPVAAVVVLEKLRSRPAADINAPSSCDRLLRLIL